MANYLFVCSKNKWRSRTAESIFKNNGQHQVKSCGTENGARIKISESLVSWANVVFAMEEKHERYIRNNYPELSREIEFINLGIPDDYKYMDEELINELKASVHPYL